MAHICYKVLIRVTLPRVTLHRCIQGGRLEIVRQVIVNLGSIGGSTWAWFLARVKKVVANLRMPLS